MKILFMCVANSARSQLAEGLAKQILGSKAEIQSAGSQPTKVNPFATQVLKEIGVDISNQHSKSIDDLDPKFINNLNFVITLCADEVCPALIAKNAKRLHWPFTDPASQEKLSELESLHRFREAREGITKAIQNFKAEHKL